MYLSRFLQKLSYPRHAGRLSLAYAVLAGSSVYLLDTVVAYVVTDPATLAAWQSYRSAVLVLLTTLLVYILFSGAEKAIDKATDKAMHETGQALRDSEERFRQLAEYIRDVLWLWDIDQERSIYVSPAYEEVWDRSRRDLEARPQDWLEGIHPEDRARVQAAHLQKGITGVFAETYRIVRPDGTLRWIRDRAFPIYDATGRLYRLAGIAEDITERKQTELALLESQRRLQALFDDALDAILLADDEGRFVEANPAACTLLARPREEVLRMTLLEMMPDSDRQRVHGWWKAFARLGGKRSGEHTLLRKDGALIEVEYRAVAGILPGLHLAILHDTTERKRAAEQLRQQQAQLAHMARLCTASELAGGLAHEINQPLFAITTYAKAGLHLLHSGESRPDSLIDLLEKIADQGLRAGETIRRLRRLLRKTEPKKKMTDLNEPVRGVIRLIAPEAHQGAVKIQLHLTDPLPPVLADAVQIQQVILNLVRNSLEALQEVPAEQRELIIQTGLADSQGVEIAVADTGPGLSAEAVDRLFQPFFTTKASGMGLGLSLSRSIIEAHGGHFWATSNPERGAIFHCVIPK